MTESMEGAVTSPLEGRVRWYHSLRTRIALWCGLLILVFLVGVTLASAWYLRREILDNARRDTRATAADAAGRLENNLRTLTIASDNLARLVAHTSLTPDELEQAQIAALQAVPGAAGTLLIVEPRQPGEAHYARYIGRNGRHRDFITDGFDYRARAWFGRTRAAGRGWWSDPYLNQTAGRVWMTTYNVPLPDGAVGMVSFDMELGDLIAPIESLAHLPGVRATLLAPEGLVAFSSLPGIALRSKMEDYIRREGRTDLAELVEAARERRPTYQSHRDTQTGQLRFSVLEPIGDSGWVLMVGQTYDPIIGRFNSALALLLAGSMVVALLGAFLVRKIGEQISRPMEDLTRSAVKAMNNVDGRSIAEIHGDPMPQQHRLDEVGVLARTMEQARHSIRSQLSQIENMGAARQKLESELSIARDIQEALLADGRRFDIGLHHLEADALLEPAKAVGGDFYNFIEHGDELWFVIGDVSDKGIPAAMFMARTVTMLEIAIQTAATPAHALAEASRRLARGNDTCMFATVLCGRINVHTGELWMASAGHESPLLIGRHQVTTVPVLAGPPLGFEVSDDFPLWAGRLAAGDCLVAITDGVTEAFNLGNEAYGDERLARLLEGLDRNAGAAEACQKILDDVRRFIGDAPPSDDTTILAISWGRGLGLDNGPSDRHSSPAGRGETGAHQPGALIT